MKKLVLIICISLFTTTAIFSQENIFNKYSKTKGVTNVYISKTMLSLIQDCDPMDQMLGLDSNDVNIDKDMLRNLENINILISENSQIVKDIETDFSQTVTDEKYQLFMKIDDEINDIEIYIIKNEDIIENILLKFKFNNNGQLIIISFTGKMTEQNLANLITQ
ncbi:MAG: DUF4252 domain-containing protein [Bacteroidales bacterium]